MGDGWIDEATSIFEQPWWLDAVAPGKWDATVVERNGEIVARMPYVVEKRKGMTFIKRAPLTQTYGPFLRLAADKPSTRIAEEHKLLEALIEALPPFDRMVTTLSPLAQNWLPFHWHGFTQTTRYTYRLTDLADKRRLWEGFRSNIRRDVRKAEKQVQVRTDLPLDDFLKLNSMTFERQGRQRPYGTHLVKRLDAACDSRDARRMWFAVDQSGEVHAAMYCVFDNETYYYLMGGGDPALRSSGATSLLMWHAIQHAATVSRCFDFEGSMLRPVERFFRSFGATQTPFHRLEAKSARLRRRERVAGTLMPWRDR